MAKKKDPPEEDGAPAYMAQFTALMTILLAFFICMLTMGQQKASQYKKQGYGFIKNAFGAKGGLGLMGYWRTVQKNFPKVPESVPEDDDGMQAYVKGAFTSGAFDAEEISRTDVQNRGYSIRIITPVIFDKDSAALSIESRKYLERVGGILSNMDEHMLTVSCYQSTGNPVKDRLIAAKRAAVVVRYLQDRCNVPPGRLRGIGYAHSKYLGDLGDNMKNQAVMFFIRKKARRIQLS